MATVTETTLSPEDVQAITDLVDRLTAAPADAVLAPDAAVLGQPTGTAFTALMMVEGLETSDHRMMELGSTTWRDVPLPLMVQDTSSHGPGQTPAPAWAAGQIEAIWRDEADESRIMAAGHLMDNDAGWRAEEIIRGAFRGVSIDGYGDSPLPADMQPTAVDQDGNPIAVLTRYDDTVLTRLTLVPTPAFAEACIWLEGEEMPACAVDAHGTEIDRNAEPEVLDVPPDPMMNGYEMLVASGGGPLNPPKEWFFTPEANRRQEIIVTADGRLYGHLFGYKECHTANSLYCDMTPPSRTTPPFVGFHRTEVHCADGSQVACGWIPVNTNHSKISHGRREAEGWSQEQTWEHYENSGTLLAKVRASNGRHGVWLSGCLLPGLDDRELAISQGLSVSGHWNVFTDPRTGRKYPDELLAILGGVPQPGYPETRVRPELLVASGATIAHISPLGPVGCADDDCEDCDEETPMSQVDLDRIARLEAVVSVLVAGASEETAAAVMAMTPEIDASDEIVADLADAGEPVELVEDKPVDLTAPLTAAEVAAWVRKYNDEARTRMVANGEARPDGSLAIGDTDDLILAQRTLANCKATDAQQRHVARAAERLATPASIEG